MSLSAAVVPPPSIIVARSHTSPVVAAHQPPSSLNASSDCHWHSRCPPHPSSIAIGVCTCMESGAQGFGDPKSAFGVRSMFVLRDNVDNDADDDDDD